MAAFRSKYERSGLADDSPILELVQRSVEELAERGSQLLAVGSQFSITRSLKGEGYEITLRASFGAKPSVLSRLRALIGV